MSASTSSGHPDAGANVKDVPGPDQVRRSKLVLFDLRPHRDYPAICGPADLGLKFEHAGVSTCRKAQRHSLATPSQSSRLPPPNSATAQMSLPKAEQTSQRAT